MIAIIAILAAILFPVFAQAKLAATMYSGDVDDVIIPDATWNGGNAMVTYGAGGDLAPWTWLMLPYMKSADLFVDPTTRPHAVLLNSRVITNYYFAEYGYSYSNLSPWDGDNRHPVGMSSIAKPSGTVMFAGKFNYTYEGGLAGVALARSCPSSTTSSRRVATMHRVTAT